jgi:hypothetical protein
MLHQSFLTGVLYELEEHGSVNPRRTPCVR